MLVTTEGIVLHSIKYGESSVIATIYTRDFGRQSYMVNAARTAKSKNRAGLLQPLFCVSLVAYQKHTSELHRVKELKAGMVYQSVPFEIAKSAVAIFLAEVLHKAIHEQESNPEMYDFIKSSLQYFDLMDAGASNFHLWFLFRLASYLGFRPQTDKAGFENWFDLKTGSVVHFQPAHPFYANKEITPVLMELASLKIQDLSGFNITRAVRENLLSVVIDYYQLHFENLGEIKSLGVLREVFGPS